MEVAYAPQFRRQFKKLQKALKEEALEKIELFTEVKNHETLKVHKLAGPLAGKHSFSVNYRYRIVFIWEERGSAILLAIGDHALYH